MKTPAAQAAALLRKEIKAAYPGVKFTCTSENYSNGCSVRVGVIDQPREIFEAIQALASKYQYGKFNGMEDIYEYNNVLEIPQAKYVFVNNEMSAELKQEIFEKIRQEWQGGLELPEQYPAACNMLLQGQYVSQMVYRTFTGAM